MRTIPPVSPGEMLEEEFLKPLGLTKYRLAKDIGVPPQRIGDIVAGKRSVTADIEPPFFPLFSLRHGWWASGPSRYDNALGKASKPLEMLRIPLALPLACATT